MGTTVRTPEQYSRKNDGTVWGDPGWQKWIIGVLTSILLTGIASWFAFGHNSVSRAQLDRELRPLTTAVRDLTGAVQQLSVTVADLRARLEERTGVRP